MDDATIALVIMSILLFVIFLGFLIWGLKSKQFENSEEAKYQLFDKTIKDTEASGRPRNPEEDTKNVK
jgi:cbb3-type cytochrome oxidase maturation protein